MTAQVFDEIKALPREPLDLPRPHENLPTDLPREIPAHTGEHQAVDATQHASEKQDFTDVKTLLSWHAPGRPFQKRSKEYFFNSFLIIAALEVILFLFGQYLLMVVVLAVAFLSFALSVVAPSDFYYKITSEGILVEDHFFLWQELYDFYFKHTESNDMLHIRTKAYLPGELVIVLGTMSKEHIKSIMLSYLPYREYIKPTFMEKSGEWLSKTFPLERTTV